jgi:uncharacterized protein YjbI with pentapeptide repeats
MWLALGGTLTLAIVVAAVVTWLGLRALHFRQFQPEQRLSAATLYDLLKIAFAVAAGVGGVVALVTSYRRQRIGEFAERREGARLFNERFATAAGQLGDSHRSVQLAGVYAMAGLADDWPERRQTCVDVLCAYLRMPYTAEPAADASELKHQAFRAAREVRRTVIRVIAAHLQPDDRRASTAQDWRDLDLELDFTGAVFDGGDFGGAEFTSGTVTFAGAHFTAGTVDFGGARFSGATVDFGRAEFTGGTIAFGGAEFADGTVDFGGARFTDGTVDFGRAEFTGGTVDFGGAQFTNSDVYFNIAQFAAGTITLAGAQFTGGTITFGAARFARSKLNFRIARFDESKVDFTSAQFTNGLFDFTNAQFPGSLINFADARFDDGALDFAGAQFTGTTIDFTRAQFNGTTIDFRHVRRWAKQLILPGETNDPPKGVLLPTSRSS